MQDQQLNYLLLIQSRQLDYLPSLPLVHGGRLRLPRLPLTSELSSTTRFLLPSSVSIRSTLQRPDQATSYNIDIPWKAIQCLGQIPGGRDLDQCAEHCTMDAFAVGMYMTILGQIY